MRPFGARGEHGDHAKGFRRGTAGVPRAPAAAARRPAVPRLTPGATMAKRDRERRRSDDERGTGPEEDAPTPPDAAPGGDGEDGGPDEVAIAAVDLVAALARLDLEAALAYDVAAEACTDRDLREQLGALAKEHRVHLEALNEALEAEGEPSIATPTPPDAALAGLLAVTGPLGDEVIVVTLIGSEQLTNLAYDAALSYEWDRESEAMLKRFQDEEERHLAWLSAKHDALGGHADPEGPDAPSP